MQSPLKAVVIGAGWAGKGHVSALRSAGVDVVAICARDSGNLKKTASSLNFPHASSDWRSVLRTTQPDIVTIATPPLLRGEIVTEAAALGIHVACEKPLAMTAEAGARMVKAVSSSGVRHAYAATQSYDPTVDWISTLIRDGLIGTPKAIEVSTHLSLFHADSPWT